MSVYDLYKPLRNLLRQYPLMESLSVVHAYTQYLQFSRPLPSDIDVNPIIYARHKPERQIYEWQLDLLARDHSQLSHTWDKNSQNMVTICETY
jgi:hypothetical protein